MPEWGWAVVLLFVAAITFVIGRRLIKGGRPKAVKPKRSVRPTRSSRHPDAWRSGRGGERSTRRRPHDGDGHGAASEVHAPGDWPYDDDYFPGTRGDSSRDFGPPPFMREDRPERIPHTYPDVHHGDRERSYEAPSTYYEPRVNEPTQGSTGHHGGWNPGDSGSSGSGNTSSPPTSGSDPTSS